MDPNFNRFDFFTESEMTLIALKLRDENKKFKKKLMALPRWERDRFLHKFFHAFILHEGKENQQELITKFLSEYK